MMTSDYITVSIQFSPKCENDEYVVVCSIFGPGMSGFSGYNPGVGGLFPGHRKQKKKTQKRSEYC